MGDNKEERKRETGKKREGEKEIERGGRGDMRKRESQKEREREREIKQVATCVV